jgi:hypothetical protein
VLLQENNTTVEMLHSKQLLSSSPLSSSPTASMASSPGVDLSRSTLSSNQLELYREVAAHAQARFNELHYHHVRVSFALDQTQQVGFLFCRVGVYVLRCRCVYMRQCVFLCGKTRFLCSPIVVVCFFFFFSFSVFIFSLSPTPLLWF